ncbi:hypothetical protein Tco_1532783 [Tanacetum coccineum]
MSQPANDEFSQHLSDDEASNHEDASDTGVKEEYDIWAMEMEHYLEYIDNDVWKVIHNGNSKKRISTGNDGVIRILPPVTAAEIQAVEKERKAKNILLMAIPKEHMRRFPRMDNAKEIWEAIRTRFGGNANSKKMQKAIFKQQFEAFTISSSEGSLPPAWSNLAMTMRTKPDVDTLSIDDLYNNLRVFEQEIQGASKTSSSAQNVAFVSQSKSSTNKVKSGFTSTYSTCTPSTSSTNTPEKEALAGFANEVIYSLFAKQSEDWDLLYEDLEQIDDLDIEEIYINWQIAMIAIRMKKECTAKGTHDGKKKRDSFYQHQEARKQEKNQMGLLIIDDGIVNWGEHTEDEETNHALMAISSSSEVSLCSKTCIDSYNTLKTLCDEQMNRLGDQEAQILAYNQAVKKLEAQLDLVEKIPLKHSFETESESLCEPRMRCLRQIGRRIGMILMERELGKKKCKEVSKEVVNTGNGGQNSFGHANRINHLANNFWALAVKTSARLLLRNSRQKLQFLTVSLTLLDTVNAKGPQADPSLQRPGAHDRVTRINRGILKEFNGGSVTFGGISEETNSAGTSQTPESIASEEKDEEVELIVVPSASSYRIEVKSLLSIRIHSIHPKSQILVEVQPCTEDCNSSALTSMGSCRSTSWNEGDWHRSGSTGTKEMKEVTQVKLEQWRNLHLQETIHDWFHHVSLNAYKDDLILCMIVICLFTFSGYSKTSHSPLAVQEDSSKYLKGKPHWVMTLEGFEKRNLCCLDSEEEETEVQGRKRQDDLRFFSTRLVTPPTTKVNASGGGGKVKDS